MLAEKTEDTTRWKHKYYASLDELERKEAHWAKVEETLQQSLSRLSLAAYGVDGDLDRRIDRLREALRQRSEAERIGELSEEVHKLAARKQDARAEEKTTNSPAAVLRGLVDAIEIPAALQGKRRRLLERLGAGDGTIAAGKLTRDVAALLDAALECGADAPRRKGLLGRVLGGGRETAADGATPAPGEPLARLLDAIGPEGGALGDVDDLARAARAATDAEMLDPLLSDLAARLRAALGADAPPARTSDDETAIEPMLDALLRAMELPAECMQAREALQTRLSEPVPTEELPGLIEEIAALVGVVRAQIEHERDEMHRFLAALTARLQSLDGFLETTDEARTEAMHASRNLHESVTAEVGEIRDVARDAADLEDLRQFVESRVETVQRHMRSFLMEAETRDRHAEEEIARLGEELESTRSEAGELRTRLDEARALAMRDGLTGLYNRAALEDRLDSEEARWRRYGEPLALLMWDIDRFKALNDGFGHLAGDKVLKAVARILDRGTRESDFVARYGGEEFVVLLPNTSEVDAGPIAEKLRVAIEAAGFKNRGEAVEVTASCGATAMRSGESARDAMRRADAALYAAKERGRNRVVAAD